MTGQHDGRVGGTVTSYVQQGGLNSTAPCQFTVFVFPQSSRILPIMREKNFCFGELASKLLIVHLPYNGRAFG